MKSNELDIMHGVKSWLGVMKNKKISWKCQSGHQLLMSLLKIDWGDGFWVSIIAEKQRT